MFGHVAQDNVEFKSDMQKSVWRILNPSQVNTITTKSAFYQQIFDFRKGVHTLRTDSLAEISGISNATIQLLQLQGNQEEYTLKNYTEDEVYDPKIPTLGGNITLDLLKHELVNLGIVLNISHHDEVVSKLTKKDYVVHYNISIDNTDHSGLADVLLYQSMAGVDTRNLASASPILVLDLAVLLICMLSTSLVIRSLFRAQLLRSAFSIWHQQNTHEPASLSDYNEFVDGWYILMLVSDMFIILGSCLKLDVQTRMLPSVDDYQNSCMSLGIGCLLCYSGILRYLGYFRGYNILVLTLSHAMPKVFKFLSCALTLYSGYVVCGWLVLGPFNPKFRTLTITSETLFSLLNGDDMFATFRMLEPGGPHIFSQIYLYSFICIFIYTVLSLFIAVVMDSYDTIKKNNGNRIHSKGITAALTSDIHNDQAQQEPSHSFCLNDCICVQPDDDDQPLLSATESSPNLQLH